MKKVRKNFINHLIEKFEKKEPYSENEKGLFFAKDKNRFIACDNTNGDCFVEDFKHLWAVHDYLHTTKPLEVIQEEDNTRKYSREEY